MFHSDVYHIKKKTAFWGFYMRFIVLKSETALT